ncbi:hypothetical protein AAVH_13182 [Aphelenchoides avenae]|nr:hypothetical protein AAVH_13182 [Aphelenchus avenae]
MSMLFGLRKILCIRIPERWKTALCPRFEAHGEAELTVYAFPKDVLRQFNWDDYLGGPRSADASGTVYEYATNGVSL